jgi:hypothetical protein
MAGSGSSFFLLFSFICVCVQQFFFCCFLLFVCVCAAVFLLFSFICVCVHQSHAAHACEKQLLDAILHACRAFIGMLGLHRRHSCGAQEP